jgi:hypothetical protein
VEVVKGKFGEVTVWTRLAGVSLAPDEPAVVPAPPPTESVANPAIHLPGRPRMLGRWRWRLVNVVALVFWTYAIGKVFVLDVDRVLLSAVAPAALPLLDYRFVFLLLVVVLVFVLHLYMDALYVLIWPLAILFGWLPWRTLRFFWKHRSWGVFLGLLQAAAMALRDLRYNVITKSLALIAGILILTTGPSPLTWVCAAYIAYLMARSFWRRLRGILVRPSFISLQEKLMVRVMGWGWLQRAQILKEEYKATEIERYNREQAQAVVAAMAWGIGLNKGLLFYANQLDHYRRRFSPSLVFNLLSIAWVFVASLIGLSLLNIALLKLMPDQYVTGQSWAPISPVVYSLGTFWLGEAGGIHPVGQAAYLLQLVGALSGGVIVISFGLGIVLTYWRERDNAGMDDLITELKRQAQEQEERFRAEYAVTVNEAYERLQELRASAIVLATFMIQHLTSSLPEPNVSKASGAPACASASLEPEKK